MDDAEVRFFCLACGRPLGTARLSPLFGTDLREMREVGLSPLEQVNLVLSPDGDNRPLEEYAARAKRPPIQGMRGSRTGDQVRWIDADAGYPRIRWFCRCGANPIRRLDRLIETIIKQPSHAWGVSISL